jgi:hypothetical protein
MRIRRIAAEIDFEAGYPFRLNVNYWVLQSGTIQINSIPIDINWTTHKMSDIGQIIVDINIFKSPV